MCMKMTVFQFVVPCKLIADYMVLHKCHKRACFFIDRKRFVGMISYGASKPDSIPSWFFHHVCNGFGGHDLFKVFALIFFLPSFAFEIMKSKVGCTVWKVENTPISYKNEGLHTKVWSGMNGALPKLIKSHDFCSVNQGFWLKKILQNACAASKHSLDVLMLKIVVFFYTFRTSTVQNPSIPLY